MTRSRGSSSHPTPQLQFTVNCAAVQEPKISSQSFASTTIQEQVSDRLSWQPTLAFLKYAINTILVGTCCYVAIVLAFMPEHMGRTVGLAPLLLVALVCAYLVRTERHQAALICMAAGVWTVITVTAFLLDGVRAPIYYAHPLLIMFIGWSISTRAAVVALLGTTLATVTMLVLDAHGWMAGRSSAPPVLHGVVQLLVMLLAVALVTFLVSAYRRRLEDMERAKIDIEDAYTVLRQSELKFYTAFASSPVAASICTLDEGRFIDINNNFERDFGWTRVDVIGKPGLVVGLWPEEQLRHTFAETLYSRGRTVDYETQWYRKNGERRHVSISAEIIELNDEPCIIAYATDITDRKAAEEQIQRLAFFDHLTGLPNRRLLMDRLDQAMTACARHERQGALLFIDLDNFKTINDTHGHAKGDLLLEQVGVRLRTCVRNGDTVARLGGDEFVVMLEDLSNSAVEAATQAENVGRKVLTVLNEEYPIQDLCFNSTPSIGITLFGASVESLEEPLKRADLAMYQAKSAGRNTIRFFDPRMQALIAERATLEADLRTALLMDQFELYYQPQVQRDGLTVGAEVLVRWQHPVRGTVMPGEFIPLLEETGLIIQVGERILELACQQLAHWATRPGMAHLSISVNVSARQFQQENFVEQVLGVLERTGAPPQRLQLELTESLLIANVDDVIVKMEAIKACGVSFSLDDFGTGYSSLSYLKRLPLKELKIDQSFVRDILVDSNDAAIARMVILLAESLGLQVVAEGVETGEQQQALNLQGCYTYQGYHFSRPLPIQDFERLSARAGWPNISPAAQVPNAGPQALSSVSAPARSPVPLP